MIKHKQHNNRRLHFTTQSFKNGQCPICPSARSNCDLLKKARGLKVNLSTTLEQALKDELKSIEAEKWKRENQCVVDAYNELVAENGCLGEE